MTVDEAIKKLQEFSYKGFGDYEVKVYDRGDYYNTDFFIASEDDNHFVQVE